MYVFKDQLEAGEAAMLDKLYREAAHVSVYQHPFWPDPLQSNQQKRFFLQKEGEDMVLSAKITESHLSKAPFVKYAYVRGGFICKDNRLLFPAVKELLQYYRQQRFAQLTVELFCDIQQAELLERSLRKEGINFSHNFATGARATLLLSLADEIETIHERFANVLKRNILTARKKGAAIREVTSAEEFEKFVAVYIKMEQARGVKLGSAGNLKNLFYFIQSTGLGHFLACYDKTGILIGGILLFKEGRQIEYIIGASDPDHKSIPQLHLALYEGIKLAKSEGIEFFDFGGYGFNEVEGSQVYGINQFKQQFGGSLAFYPKNIIFKTNNLNSLVGGTFVKMKSILG